jgi:hypothetical protein
MKSSYWPRLASGKRGDYLQSLMFINKAAMKTSPRDWDALFLEVQSLSQNY